MIKKLPLLIIALLSINSFIFSQNNSGKTYWYTSPDSNGYISFQRIVSDDKSDSSTILNTKVRASFDGEILNFDLSTVTETEKMIFAKSFSFHGTIGAKIEPVNFSGTKIKSDKKDISFWHFKGDFVEDMETDPDIQRFNFAKYNATLKLPARTIPSFNIWAIIPRLPFDRKGTFKFNALDETKLYVKKNQTINYLGTTNTDINGKKIKLHKFVHQGKGMLPAYYWVSEDRELMQVLLDNKYTFTISSKEAALQTEKSGKSE
ncbi:hypothetical protein EGM88_01370 [Aureibaculum marinum]|uniref:DUF3108 domain-containing protein n=1 Tax=Aureibaculum marinum TaxID=2487930 RepID=A0A3N4NUV2_9FLAO|nr:hypothetical protein [Aureibaculum marinum]RPD99944.1 hypothetical protein EGM88_01370 [Aureibaculum marinum]